jgi:hypothetical protein
MELKAIGCEGANFDSLPMRDSEYIWLIQIRSIRQGPSGWNREIIK